MLADVINPNLKTLSQKGAEFDTTVTSVKNLKDLAYFNSVLGTYEGNLVKQMVLNYILTLVTVQYRTQILINSDIDGSITRDWRCIRYCLKILRLGEPVIV